MSTRIRYVKSPDGGIESMRMISLPDGSQVKVKVLANNTAVVLDSVSLDLLYGKACTSQHAAKMYIKEILTKLGVEFGKETRTRVT